MKAKKIKFVENKKAVSAIIGMLLMFAIVVGMYGAYQRSAVPVWNKGVEYDHLDVVYSDMMSLKSDIEDVALLESPKSSDIHLGVRYPERMIFMNPGEGASGMLTIEEDVKILVEYSVVNISGVATPAEPLTFNTSRITYELYGTINSPKYVYEHGIIIRDYRTSNATTDAQLLIVGDNIYIPVVNANASSTKSSLGLESLAIYPFINISCIPRVKNVNITMNTTYPGIWWDPDYRAEFEAQFLPDPIPNELKSRDILGNLSSSSVNVSVSGNKIYINSTAAGEINYPKEEKEGVRRPLSAGIITFGAVTGELSWPYIVDIWITVAEMGGSETIIRSIINATVHNVTSPLDIHADLSGLTKDPSDYDVQPDYSHPDSLGDVSWSLPNSNNISWNVSHPGYKQKTEYTTASVTFLVENTGSGTRFSTTRVFICESAGKWSQ